MAETTMPCDGSSWAFDPLNPGPGFNLGPTFASDEEMLYRSQFGFNDFDLASWQPLPAETGAEYEFAFQSSGKVPANGFHGHRQSFMLQPSGEQRPTSGRTNKLLSRLGNFHPAQDLLAADNGSSNAQHFPYTLDELLRSTSQLATERALYMNAPTSTPSVQGHSSPSHQPHYQSPVADPCVSSPSQTSHRSSSVSDGDWEREQELELAAATTQVYRLPVADQDADGYFSPMHPSLDHVAAGHEPRSAIALTTTIPGSAGDQNRQAHAHAHAQQHPKVQTQTVSKSHHRLRNGNNNDYQESMTPLEMPDGTTRFTANWLPVDPEGGFTIHTPAPTTPATTAGDSLFDLDLMDYPPVHHNAFISLEAGLSHPGV